MRASAAGIDRFGGSAARRKHTYKDLTLHDLATLVGDSDTQPFRLLMLDVRPLDEFASNHLTGNAVRLDPSWISGTST